MNATVALLRSCSYHSEKLFKKRGRFDAVLFIAETAAGTRHTWESACTAPESVTDTEVLEGLAADASIDMAEIGAVRFVVAFLQRHVITYTPIELDLPPTIRRSEVIMVEAHDTTGAHLRTVHEIIQSPSGRGMLGAMSAPVSAADSLYAEVLCRQCVLIDR